MNCIYCKGKIEPRATTCPHCGAPVGKECGSGLEDIPEMLRNAANTVTNTIANIVKPNENGRKSKYLAGLLGIFLGGFGIHNFYLGRNERAIVQLLLFWTGISEVWGFIEGLLCLFGDYKDGKGQSLQ